MTRREAEAAITEKVREIIEIYKKYNPNGSYLAISIINDFIYINNEYWEIDANKPINISITEEDNIS